MSLPPEMSVASRNWREPPAFLCCTPSNCSIGPPADLSRRPSTANDKCTWGWRHGGQETAQAPGSYPVSHAPPKLRYSGACAGAEPVFGGQLYFRSTPPTAAG